MVETRTAYIELREDGILRIISKPGVHVTVEDARENMNAGKKLIKDGKVLTLVDIRGMISIDRGARQIYAEESLSYAEAVVFGSLVSKVIASFLMGLNKPRCLVRLFTSETEAIEWLKGISNE